MKTIYSDRHTLHDPCVELRPGSFANYQEIPDRAFYIRDAIRERGLGAVVTPEDFSLAPVLAVHDEGYVAFLRDAHAAWEKMRVPGDAFAACFNVQHPDSPPPQDIHGKLGFYTADGCVPITATSWEAIKDSAFVALTAQAAIAAGDSSVFALCRPPGHHATRRVAAGYCFLNNAAIAAQAFIDRGAKRVAVLDVDYHHGNGTQDIFYDRDDVLFVSIHGDPAFEYPSFRGYAEERRVAPHAERPAQCTDRLQLRSERESFGAFLVLRGVRTPRDIGPGTRGAKVRLWHEADSQMP